MRRLAAAVVTVLALVAAVMLIGAPAHADAPVVVDSAPPAPVFVDECGTDADSWAPSADPGPWLYEATTPVLEPSGAVIDQGYITAYLPDGYVLPNGDTSWTAGYWELSHYLTDVPCPVDAPAPAVPAPAVPAPPAPPLTELPATGPADYALVFATGGAMLTAGTLLIRRARRD